MSRPYSGVLICQDCGAYHPTGQEAIECDHRIGRHKIWFSGCDLCASELRRINRKATLNLAPAPAEEGSGG